jgi:Arc/MetJ family transcription regulator
MRLHIELDNELVAEIDQAAGPRARSRFIRDAISNALRHERQRQLLASTRGGLAGNDHDWDRDPAEWVRAQRTSDHRRVG